MSNYNLRDIKLGLIAKPEKEKYVMPKKSAKKKETDKKLKKIANDLKLVSPYCDLRIEGVCTGLMQGTDHVVKRSPGNVLDKDNIVRACNACNTWKEQNSAKANEMGISKSKFTPALLTLVDGEVGVKVFETI